MYKLKYRSRTFDELVGQESAKSILKKVANSPEGKPQCYLLQGAWGCGKSSLARIFARALNCKGRNKPCLECDECLKYPDMRGHPSYLEYDAAMVGNVNAIKAHREVWSNLPKDSYKVIVLDEMQETSREGQGSLLEFTENPPEKTFIIFCTTDPDKIIKPLISRSMVLEFNPLSESEIGLVVDRIVKEESIEMSDEVRKLIARRSLGHARDAVALLERYSLLGEETFRKSIIVVDNYIMGVIKAAVEGNNVKAEEYIKRLEEVPLLILTESLEKVLKKLMEVVMLENRVLFDRIDEMAMMKIFAFYSKFSTVVGSSTINFCSFMYALFASVKKEIWKEKAEQPVDRFKKR